MECSHDHRKYESTEKSNSKYSQQGIATPEADERLMSTATTPRQGSTVNLGGRIEARSRPVKHTYPISLHDSNFWVEMPDEAGILCCYKCFLSASPLLIHLDIVLSRPILPYWQTNAHKLANWSLPYDSGAGIRSNGHSIWPDANFKSSFRGKI